MIFEPCPSGDCGGKLMVSSTPPVAAADEPAPAAASRAYCPLCRQSFERRDGDTAWQLAGAQLA